MPIAALKLGHVGQASDNLNAGNGTSAGTPGTNGTWTNFIAGTTTSDTAFAAAGFIEIPYLDGSGVQQMGRIPVFKV